MNVYPRKRLGFLVQAIYEIIIFEEMTRIHISTQPQPIELPWIINETL